jgi:precorrin-6A/cobalt-precorrin-6A reductase
MPKPRREDAIFRSSYCLARPGRATPPIAGSASQTWRAPPPRWGARADASFEAAPQHFYLIRSIEPVSPSLPRCRVIEARGPFDAKAEERLLRDEMIDIIVTKNSGSAAVFGKILAARRLGLSVVMVKRPSNGANAVHDPAEALDLILRHGARLAPRGV